MYPNSCSFGFLFIKKNHFNCHEYHEYGKNFLNCFLWQTEGYFTPKITSCQKTDSEESNDFYIYMPLLMVGQYR